MGLTLLPFHKLELTGSGWSEPLNRKASVRHMWTVTRSSRRIVASICFIVVPALLCGACDRTNAAKSDVVAPTPRQSGSSVSSSSVPASGPLKAPNISVAQDGQFFTEVAEADSALATYERQQGNVALRALLTDGSAFCSILQRGGGVDNALVTLALGARSVEPQTHLPLSVTTFNTIESVALLTLCPSNLKLLPASDQVKVRDLGITLASR